MTDFFNRIFDFGSSNTKRGGDQQWNEPGYNGFNFSNSHTDDFSFGPNSHDNLFSVMEDFMSAFSQDFGMFPAIPGMDQGNRYPRQRAPPQRTLRDQLLKKPEEEEEAPFSYNNQPHSQNQRFFHHDSMDSLFENFFNRSHNRPFVEKPVIKKDTDLDSDVRQSGLDSILKRDESENQQSSIAPSHYQSFRSESRSMIRRPDGSSEQRITRRSSDGTDETTIISETPSGERRTEVLRNDGSGSVEIVDDGTQRERFNLTKPGSPFQPTEIFPGVNSFFNYFFGK